MPNKPFSIEAGYIPLNDAAIVIIAKECGFAEKEGLALHLHKETSWATLRDKLAIGLFDVAHLLAPIPVAAACNLFPLPLDIVVPMALGLGGNMITMSRKVWELHLGTAEHGDFEPFAAGRALMKIVKARATEGLPKLKFGVVHPYSSHNYELRYWLAGCGIHPDRDLDLVFLPPSMMPEALSSGSVDAFCVGEPWNSATILSGDGVLLTTKAHIWRSSPEKVLGVRRSFADKQPQAHMALLRALYQAACWIDDPANIPTICEILSRPEYIGIPADQLHPGFSGAIHTGFAEPKQFVQPDFYISCERAATFPWPSHSLWFYSQMIRWGHAQWSQETADKVKAACNPDYLRDALAPLGVPLPIEQNRIEGTLGVSTAIKASTGMLEIGPDGFFDERQFDPDAIDAYVTALTDQLAGN